jgi:hypothetical protein
MKPTSPTPSAPSVWNANTPSATKWAHSAEMAAPQAISNFSRRGLRATIA